MLISLTKKLSRQGIFLIIGLSVAIHLLLFIFDLNNPEAYLVGDRALQRINIIEKLLEATSSTSLVKMMIGLGSPGDYIFHYLIYAWQGIQGVILIQVLLQLIAIIYIYRIGLLILGTSGLSLLAASIYAILPSSLFHPHVLVSEAFFNPLIILSFFYSIRYLGNPKDRNVWDLIISALAGSCASFIRQIYLLYPFFIVILFLWLQSRYPNKFRHAVAYLIVSFVIPLFWVSYMFIQTGSFTMGESRHDLHFNLYGRIERMEQLDHFEIKTKQKQRRRLQLSEYLDYVFEHPLIFLKTLGSDVSNLALNSGINSLLGRYLGLYEMSNKNKKYWRHIRDKEGLWSLIKTMYTYSLLMLLVNLLITPLWLIFICGSVFGGFLVIRDTKLKPAVRAVLVLLPIYLFLTSQIAISVRWGFRTPFEFILVLLFVAFVSWFMKIGWRRNFKFKAIGFKNSEFKP